MAVTYVGAGAVASGADVASLTPALPASLQDGDCLLCLVCVNAGITITKDAAWTQIDNRSQSGTITNLTFKEYHPGDAAPVIGLTLSASKTVVAQVAAFRGVDTDSLAAIQDQKGALSGGGPVQDMGPITGITPTSAKSLILAIATRRNNPTSIAPVSGDGLTWNEIAELNSSLGGISIGSAWDYAIDTGTTPITAKTFTVTGGATANWGGWLINLRAEPRPTNVKASGAFATRLTKLKASGAFNQVERRICSAGALTLGKSDVGAAADAAAVKVIWGAIEAAADSRWSLQATGGDTRTKPDGVAQGNTSYYRMTVVDGDDFVGERAELGYNSWKNPIGFKVFTEGLAGTFWESIRVPAAGGLDCSTSKWQVLTQLKPTGPSVPLHASPPLALEARSNAWVLTQFGGPVLWQQALTKDVWWQFRWDLLFSRTGAGSVRLRANDGTTTYDSGAIATATLDTNVGEVSYGGEGVVIHDGDPIPGTVRVGVYHDPTLPGGYAEFDNVHWGTFANLWTPL